MYRQIQRMDTLAMSRRAPAPVAEPAMMATLPEGGEVVAPAGAECETEGGEVVAPAGAECETEGGKVVAAGSPFRQ